MSISPLAYVSPDAELGHDVTVDEFTAILGRTRIGAGTKIGSHCSLGRPADADEDSEPLVIGPGSRIRSHSIFYAGSSFGEGLTTGHGAVVRDRIRAGKFLQVGSAAHLEGDSIFGDCVRTNTNTLLGRRTTVGDFAHVSANVATFNDPFPPSEVHLGVTISDLAFVGGATLLFPGVRVGFGSFVAAGSVVRHHVEDATCVKGDPAQPFCMLRSFLSLEHRLRAPWPSYFRRGYAAEMLPLLDDLARRLEARMDELEGAV